MTSRAAQRPVRCNSRPLGLQEEANGGKVTAYLPDQPLAAMVAGPNTLGTACGFGRGPLRCRGQPRRRAGYPARLRRGCSGIAAANRLGRLGESLARRSGWDWRPKQQARLPSSELVRNRVRPAVVDSRVSVLAGERCRQALGVLATLVLDRHARTSLRRSAVCPAGKPIAALSGETPGLTRCCSRPLRTVTYAVRSPSSGDQNALEGEDSGSIDSSSRAGS